MAGDLYQDPLPVVMVSEGTTGPEVLFESPLPVFVVNQDSGEGDGGGSTPAPIPDRLAAQLPEFSGSIDDINATGWFYKSGVNSIPTGNSRKVLIESIVESNGTIVHVLHDIDSLKVYRRYRKAGATTWSYWLAVGDSLGSVDTYARDQMRYADRMVASTIYVDGEATWNGKDTRTGVIELLLGGDGQMPDLVEWSNSDEAIQLTVIVRQMEDGGKILLWPSNLVWTGGSEPTLASAPNAVDVVKMIGTTTGWVGYGVGPTYLS